MTFLCIWHLIGLGMLAFACGTSEGTEPAPGTGSSGDVPATTADETGPEATSVADDDGAPPPGSTGSDSSSGDETSSSTGESSDGPGDLGCDTPVFEQDGVVKIVTHDDSYWNVSPLPTGASFRCLRLTFEIQTVDSQQEILDMYEGCPIFLGIAAVDGQGPEGRPMASMLFKPWRVGCTPGPDRVELDTFADALVEEGPWPLGELYEVSIEVNLDTETSTVILAQDGVQVGPSVTAALTGITDETARDPRVGLGMEHPAGDAYFPDYGATYSNVRITADVIP
jgi:hypothetical protein